MRIRTLSFAAAIAIAAAAVIHAQSPSVPAPAPAQAPAFEVASVKPSDPNPPTPLAGVPMVLPPAGGRVRGQNLTLRLLVRIAYQVEDFQITGGPSWQASRKFDITAQAPAGVTGNDAIAPMLKTLLADRFKLRAHTEMREMPIYSLVLAHSDGTLGNDMKPSTSDCSNAAADAQKRAAAIAKDGAAALLAQIRAGQTLPCTITPRPSPSGVGLHGDGQPLSTLTRLLTSATGRVVQDKTGLSGLYDWDLKFDPEVFLRLAAQVGVTLPPQVAVPPPSDSPALLTAIQEQLGLKLESTRGPVQLVVIDSAELPDAD